jgi:cytoskeletal protein CcmA (bactofilin family)
MHTSAQIGPSIRIKGDVTAQEDLVIAGHVEGNVTVEGHILTVNPGGHVCADIAARAIIVGGKVKGRLTAGERIELRGSAEIEGDLTAPRIGVAEGAAFHGRVDMPPRPRVALSEVA